MWNFCLISLFASKCLFKLHFATTMILCTGWHEISDYYLSNKLTSNVRANSTSNIWNISSLFDFSTVRSCKVLLSSIHFELTDWSLCSLCSAVSFVLSRSRFFISVFVHALHLFRHLSFFFCMHLFFVFVDRSHAVLLSNNLLALSFWRLDLRLFSEQLRSIHFERTIKRIHFKERSKNCWTREQSWLWGPS